MSDETVRISELPIASDLEITPNIWAILNTELNQTKRTQFSNLIRLLFGDVKMVKVTVLPAQTLVMHSAPTDIIPACGVGKAIEVIRASYRCRFNTTAFATNMDIELRTKSATKGQLRLQSGLDCSVDTHRTLNFQTVASGTDTQLIENMPVQLYEHAGDPTAGDSEYDYYVLYREITL
jgi:hypothetical protein